MKKSILLFSLIVLFLFLVSCGKSETISDADLPNDEISKSDGNTTFDSELSDEVIEKNDKNTIIEETKVLIESIVFTNENDRKYLSPDTDDYRIIYQELPEITVFPGWGISGVANSICFCGISDGSNNARIKAWCIDVISYDESGNFVSQKQKIWVDNEDDAMTLMYTEKACAYWFDTETGTNAVPDDFDADSTVRYCTDTILSRDVHEYTPDLSFVKRIDNAFYGQVDTDGYEMSLLASHVAFAGVVVNGNEFAADFADEAGLIHRSIKYDFEADDDPESFGFATRHIEYSYADCMVWYSKPDNHKKGLIRGNGDIFDGRFPDAAYEDGFIEEPQDSEFYTPLTEDYFLYYIIGEYSRDHNEQSVLISFDEKGNPVDIRMRYYRSSISELDELISNYDYLGAKLLYSDNENLFYIQIPARTEDRPPSPYDEGWDEDTKLRHLGDFNSESGIFCPFRGNMNNCHAYLNVPTIDGNMLLARDMIDFYPEDYWGNISLPTEDYIVIPDEPKDNGENTAEKVFRLYFFDEEGRIVDNGKLLYLFDSEEKAQRVYRIILDQQGEIYKPCLYRQCVMINITETSIFIWKTKQTLLTDYINGRTVYDGLWFSVPYLTDKQIEAWNASNWS